MGLFSSKKSYEYNEKLENILENKKIDSSAKNLLLSMLYKIENAYDDYYTVKTNVKPLEEFIEKILKIIEYECNEILAVVPGTTASEILDDSNQNCYIDVKKGKIVVYANEKDLLYSIIMLDLKYNQYKIDKEYDLENSDRDEVLKYRAVQNFLSFGSSISESEVIRDFSGWSWTTNFKDIENIDINLIYQNMLLLLDPAICENVLMPKIVENKFENMEPTVEDLRKINEEMQNKNGKKKIESYNEVVKEAFSKKFSFAKTRNLIYCINLAILAIEVQNNRKQKRLIEDRYKEELSLIKLMDDKKSFLQKLEKNKETLRKENEKIDKILNDQKLLVKEYNSRNEKLADKDKIFSVSHLAKMLEQEKKKNEKEIQLEEDLKDEKKYIIKYNQYLKEARLYEEIIKASKNMYFLKIKIQKEFLKCFNTIVESTEKEEELIKLLYKFRYYNLMPFENNKKIYELPELEEDIKNVINLMLDKCINKKIIENVSNSISLCYCTLKNMFITQTIELKNISIKVTKEDEEIKDNNRIYHIKIDFFDGNEQMDSYNEVVDNLKLLNIRLKKKVQLFI